MYRQLRIPQSTPHWRGMNYTLCVHVHVHVWQPSHKVYNIVTGGSGQFHYPQHVHPRAPYHQSSQSYDQGLMTPAHMYMYMQGILP